MKHILGTPAAEDREVFSEDDETFITGVGKTKSEQYITITSYSTLSSEVRVIDANEPDAEFGLYSRER